MAAEHRKPPARRFISPRGWRDTVLFFAGLGGVFYETVYSKADRPTLLLLFAAMMGLPAFLRTDEQRKPPPEDKPALPPSSPPPGGRS